MCLNPQTITVVSKHPGSRTQSVRVNCGKCVQCVSHFQNDWRFRLIEQTKAYPKAVFGTLTYSPENIPQMVDKETGETTGTVFQPDVQKWIHRSITRLDRHGIKDVSYYICSEYGTTTFRPHYHFIVWNVSRADFIDCLSDWQSRFGFTQCSDIDTNRVAGAAVYVSKYATKGQFEVDIVKTGKAAPNFKLVSKGIGEKYLNELKSFVRLHHLDEIDRWKTSDFSEDFLETIYRRLNYVTPDGKIFSLPRYYVTKIIPPKTALARRYSDYVLKRRMEFNESRNREIANSMVVSLDEANVIRESQEIATKIEQSKSLVERQNRFYFKSKL